MIEPSGIFPLNGLQIPIQRHDTALPAGAAVLALFCGAYASALTLSSASYPEAAVIEEVDRVQEYRDRNLAGYSVTEHYTIKNSHFAEPAEAVVRSEYQRGVGKTYRVLSRTGPSLLRGRVIDRILQEEANMSRGEERRNSLLTTANYEFRLIGEEYVRDEKCWLLELTPRRKSPHLLRGRVWVDYASKALVRIEGQPPMGAALFAGRPMVIRDYRTIDGFALAQHSHATSAGLIQGKTEVDIAYDDYAVRRLAGK